LCGQKDYVNERISVTPSGIDPVNFRLVAHAALGTAVSMMQFTTPFFTLSPWNGLLYLSEITTSIVWILCLESYGKEDKLITDAN